MKTVIFASVIAALLAYDGCGEKSRGGLIALSDPEESCECAPGPAGPKGDQGEPGDAHNTSGSRLKARTIAGEDGSSRPDGFFDPELGVPCDFSIEPGNDPNVSYCYPTQVTWIPAPRLFADPLCKNPLVTLNDGCTYARSLVERVVWECEPAVDFYLYKLGEDGSCEDGGVPAQLPTHVLTPVDPDELVRGHEVVDP